MIEYGPTEEQTGQIATGLPGPCHIAPPAAAGRRVTPDLGRPPLYSWTRAVLSGHPT